MLSFSLEGKTILITGASSGIGARCAIDCAAQGASVILCGRNEEKLNLVFDKMIYPERHMIQSFDLRNHEIFKDLFQKIRNKYSHFDGYIGSAGISQTLPFRVVNSSHIDEVFEANVKGQYLLLKELTKKSNFNHEGGSIVLISSVMAMVGEVAKSTYALTKGAISSMTKSLAIELAPRKIRFNTINPGVVVTPMSSKSPYFNDNSSLEEMKKKHLLGLGVPDDVSAAAIYLLSNASKWVTGTELIVDGGYTAH